MDTEDAEPSAGKLPLLKCLEVLTSAVTHSTPATVTAFADAFAPCMCTCLAPSRHWSVRAQCCRLAEKVFKKVLEGSGGSGKAVKSTILSEGDSGVLCCALDVSTEKVSQVCTLTGKFMLIAFLFAPLVRGCPFPPRDFHDSRLLVRSLSAAAHARTIELNALKQKRKSLYNIHMHAHAASPVRFQRASLKQSFVCRRGPHASHAYRQRCPTSAVHTRSHRSARGTASRRWRRGTKTLRCARRRRGRCRAPLSPVLQMAPLQCRNRSHCATQPVSFGALGHVY